MGKSQMREILDTTNNAKNVLPHYYYTSPSVVSDAVSIPNHLFLQTLKIPNNANNLNQQTTESLQAAYKRHRKSIDLHKLSKKRNLKKIQQKKRKKKKDKKYKHQHSDLCPCSCHNDMSPTPIYSASDRYDGDIENEQELKEQELQKPVIQSTIGIDQRLHYLDTNKTPRKKKKKKGKKKKIPISPPIAVAIKRNKKDQKEKISDLDSETILNENEQITNSLHLSGGIINDLVRFSAISPSPIWYNNRRKLHIKEIRNYSREHMVASSVCSALWTTHSLEILKLFKLSWSQRIMAFAEPSIMFYVIDIDTKNTAKQLFNIAEHRFNGLEYVELKYRLNCNKHKFALLCIVDSYYIINETDQYFVDQRHCIPSYLIRNKTFLLA